MKRPSLGYESTVAVEGDNSGLWRETTPQFPPAITGDIAMVAITDSGTDNYHGCCST